ncbi:Ig-like domain-containing protein [Nocardioides sp. WS12]|uniref:Ig-like domain-containing protein n=1 Tax=Nocardioides sp. WS12 TaxID=2486272 RepID=UPI0015FABAF3|nr:Ig-like domain-containing protein [Nocardioides sp. WS12]
MSRMQLVVRRPRRLVAGAVAALTLASVAVTAAEPAAHAANPPGSNIELFLEPTVGDYGNPANKIVGGGFWGHEGVARDKPTVFSADLLDGGTAFLSAFNTDNADNFAVVFVPTSTDGSAEEPTVTPGQTIAEVYPYFTDRGFLSAIQGNPANLVQDSVLTVSTKAEYDAWVTDGKPLQQTSSADLVTKDVFHGTAQHDPPIVAVAPKGKSILNRWAAGVAMSAVLVKTTGAFDAHGVPIVDATTGHAEAAWLPFVTKLDPAVGDGAHPNIATSGGYDFAGAKVTPTLPTSVAWSGATANLTATVTGSAGALTDATGTVEFLARPKNDSASAFASVGSVPVDPAGKATHAVTGLLAGEYQQYKAVYTPDTAAGALYEIATSNNRTITASKAVVAVTGTLRVGFAQTLTATVSPLGAPGTVTFYNGSTSLGAVAVSTSTGKAIKAVKLPVGTRVLRAVFVPSNVAFSGATSANVTKVIAKALPSITVARSPSIVRKGVRVKLLVTVKAPGLVPTGVVTVVYDPAKGATKILRVALRSGKAAFLLPAAVRGKTILKVTYSGSSTVLAAAKAVPTYTVR